MIGTPLSRLKQPVRMWKSNMLANVDRRLTDENGAQATKTEPHNFAGEHMWCTPTHDARHACCRHLNFQTYTVFGLPQPSKVVGWLIQKRLRQHMRDGSPKLHFFLCRSVSTSNPAWVRSLYSRCSWLCFWTVYVTHASTCQTATLQVDFGLQM